MAVFGVWMWPQSIIEHGARKVVESCSAIGVTDIFFLTKGLAGTVSYRSALAPQCCERDLLAELLEAAHASAIRIHAWLTSASDEHYKRTFPESGRCHYTRGKDKGLIALADEGYLAYMQKVVRELCLGYAIDGLHLDYIRYNHLLYGWAEEDLARYACAGADVAHLKNLMDRTFLGHPEETCIFDACRSGDESVLALAQTRRRDVVRFARSLTGCARAARKDLSLSAALMPEGAYEDTAFSDLHYGQNYDDAAGLYDFVLPMAYSQAYQKDGAWVRAIAEGTLKRGLTTIMGLHAYDGGTGPSLTADLYALAQTAIDGVCLFRFGAFAVAIPEGDSLRIVNTLNQPITAAASSCGDPLLSPGSSIAPGGDALLAPPAPGSSLRVFCGDTEACVYLSNQTLPSIH